MLWDLPVKSSVYACIYETSIIIICIIARLMYLSLTLEIFACVLKEIVFDRSEQLLPYAFSDMIVNTLLRLLLVPSEDQFKVHSSF